MNAAAGSFALLKSVLVHATSHHCFAQNWPRLDKLGSKTRFFGLQQCLDFVGFTVLAYSKE